MEEERDEDHTVAVSYTYDIKVLDADGEEIQPADESKVKVSFCMDEAEDDNLTANVYHITEENDGELVAEKLETETEGDTVIAETDGFSLYTVEFTYEEKQYVLQGNSEVELAEILKAVGLSGDVTKVTVSDSTLFSAEKDADGEWIVTAHKAFSSEEWMKVTINGVVYDIVVTDEIDYDGSEDINFTDVDYPEGLSIDNSFQSNQAGYYYVNMPTTGTTTIIVPDGFTSSFKIYDDGGKDSDYSSNCSGTLVLSAPEGYKIKLSGEVRVNPDSYDYLTIYDGANGYAALASKVTYDFSVLSSGNGMRICFKSGTYYNKSGLNLTAEVMPAPMHNVSISSAIGGTVTSSRDSASEFDVITLTATPDSNYLLQSVSVKDADNNAVVVSGGDFGSNVATFTMPASDVTVTPTFTTAKSAEAGLYVNMPASGSSSVVIPSDVMSFKVYDDGGSTGNYSDNCTGTLTLTAPGDYRLQLIGNVTTEVSYDYLKVYDGTNKNCTELVKKSSDSTNSTVDIETITSSGQSLTLFFYSDDTDNNSGLDLTVMLIGTNVTNPITINDATNGSVESDVSSAKVGDEVILTAIPTNSNYMLSNIIVRDENNNVIPVTGGWYTNNQATFIMPGSAVSVTATFTDILTADGGLYINMPKTGTTLVNIPSRVQSFKVYDDGGVGGSNTDGSQGNYSNNCSGTLTLTTTSDYLFRIAGTVIGEDESDYISIYDGVNSDADVLISNLDKGSISPINSSTENMTLYFHSDDTDDNEGLDLTVSLISKSDDYNITVSNDITNGQVARSVETANCNESVTLTVTPDEGYVLKSISATDNDGAISLTPSETDASWGDVSYYATNEFTFKMRSSDATVNATFMRKTDFFVKMPKTSQCELEIPADISLFKVYDSGGLYSGYDKGENGDLLLTAPDGYVMNIKGSGTIRYYKEEIDASSVLCIFDGNSNSSEKIGEYIHTRQYQTNVDETSVFSVDKTSSGHQMLIHFETPSGGMYSYSNDNFEFTVTLKKLLTNGITIQTIADQIYTGNAITPTITVMDGETDITSQCDFAYSNNTEAGTATVTITAKNTSTGYAGSITATFNIVNEPVFNNHALLLTGQVGVQFFLELPAGKTSTDYAGSYVTFSGQGINSSTHYDIPASTAVINSVDTGKYLFTVNITSIQMADKITPTFHYTENGQEKTVVGAAYSAEDYIKWAVADNHVTGKNLNIVKALADYGHYAQIYLSQQNGWSIGTDHAEMVTHTTNSYDYVAIKGAVTNDAIQTTKGANVTSVNYRLYFDDTLAICVALTPASGVTLNSVTLDGNAITPTRSGDQYLVMINDISATNLTDSHTITAGGTTVTVSAMSYVYGILNSGSNNKGKDLVCALYNYARACRQ